MNTDLRIKDKKEFQGILNSNKKIANKNYIIYYKERAKDDHRFGITLAKKFGKAFKRNYYRRRLREIIRNNQKTFSNDYDYIIIIRKSCDNISYQEMESSLINLIKGAKYEK